MAGMARLSSLSVTSHAGDLLQRALDMRHAQIVAVQPSLDAGHQLRRACQGRLEQLVPDAFHDG